jgi:NADPH:quinone reductase-like Zn-dependent oxidoreductase
MRAIVLTKQGSPVTPNIAFRTDWPELPPTPSGHLQIRALASAFNHMDLWVGRGLPGINTYPRITGCDCCGVVEGVGPGVPDRWVGQRVIINAAMRVPDRVAPQDPPASTLAPNYELLGEHHDGFFRERFHAPASNCAVVGDADPVRAAAFGLCALTAYSMIITKGQLRPGQAVLVTGIGGGVATMALGIATMLGCPTAVTSRHQWKLDAAKKLGADLCILDTSTKDKPHDWSKEVRAWTDKRGVDMAIDSIGKAAHLSCIKSLARGGAYVTPGATTGGDATTDLTRIFWNQLRILGSTMGSNEEFQEVVSLFRAGKLAPAIDKVYKAEHATDAYARLEASEQFGKIVVTW